MTPDTPDPIEARITAAAPEVATTCVAAAYEAGLRDGRRLVRPWQVAAAAGVAFVALSAIPTCDTPPSASVLVRSPPSASVLVRSPPSAADVSGPPAGVNGPPHPDSVLALRVAMSHPDFLESPPEVRPGVAPRRPPTRDTWPYRG